MRTCIGCRGAAERSELVRVVAAADSPEGVTQVVVDSEECRPGRGAWLHKSADCLRLAVRRKAFGRALRTSTQLDIRNVSSWFEHELR